MSVLALIRSWMPGVCPGARPEDEKGEPMSPTYRLVSDRLRKRELLEPEATLTEQEMASLAEVDELEDPGLGEPSREGLADDGERGSRDERELIAALACAGDTTFGPCMPGFRA
jgi:hypothetical protein